MAFPVLSPNWKRFLRQQQLYVAIAVVIYAIFWAIGQNVELKIVLIYTLFLGNFTMLIQEQLSFPDGRESLARSWAAYLTALFMLTPAAVASAVALVYILRGAQGSLWHQLRSGWKFPFVATIVVGIATHLYISTKQRLERRNLDLEQAVENGALLRELQEQELARAREIQMALLPKEIPQVPGFEIVGAWEPARTVGGDYFDVIKLSDRKLGICIADVVGKSVSAALLMANVQATVRAFASDADSPAWLCSRVNAVLCSNIATGKFVTLFYGVLDAEHGTLHYTNAGHLPPIIVNDCGEVRELDSNGALLGVFPQWNYKESVLQFAPGDRLLLFTDGITEAMNFAGEEFGQDRLLDLARGNARQHPMALKNQVLADVKRFCDSQLQDDATLIVLGFTAEQGVLAEHA